MEFVLWILLLLVCFYILAKIVDDFFIESLDNISLWLKLTPSVAGATLLAIGTSAPELSTAMFAMFLPDANPAVGLGTVVGSAIFQILVVIGFAALVKTSYLNWKPVVRDGLFYGITIILLILFVRDGVFVLWESAVLVATYILYLIILFIWIKKVPEEKSQPDPIDIVDKQIHTKTKKKSILNYITYPIDLPLRLMPDCKKNKKWTVPVFIISIIIIAFISYWLVVAAEGLGTLLGIPSVIIALTILAGGSSVPELISSFVVSKEGRGDMAISNAVGSNIFDILISLGLPILIFNIMNGDLEAGTANVTSSIFLLLATLVGILALLASQKFRIGRGVGLLLIALYGVYVLAAYWGYL